MDTEAKLMEFIEASLEGLKKATETMREWCTANPEAHKAIQELPEWEKVSKVGYNMADSTLVLAQVALALSMKDI